MPLSLKIGIDEAVKVKDLPYICSLRGCRVFNNE